MGWGTLALASCLLGGPEAVASAPAQQKDVVVIAVVDRGSGDDVQRALDSLVAHLSHTGAELIVERPKVEGLRNQIAWARRAAKRHGAVGVFWLDVEPDEELVLYLVEPEGKSALLRAIPRDPESDAATLEALGAIARSITTAVLEGAEIGMRPVQLDDDGGTDAAVAREEPRPSPPSWPRLRLALDYVGTNFSAEIPWQHGIGFDVVVRPLPPLFVGAGYAFMFPGRVSDPIITFEIQRNPVRMFLGYHASLARTLAVEVEPRFTIDPLRHDVVELKDPMLAAESPRQRVLFSGGVSARLLWYVWHNLSLYVTGGVDVVLNTFDYVVLVGGEPQTTVSPHRVRGHVNGGIAFGLVDRKGRR